MEQYTEANNAGRTGRKGGSRSVGTAEVMKYVIAVLILGYVAVILLFTGAAARRLKKLPGVWRQVWIREVCPNKAGRRSSGITD